MFTLRKNTVHAQIKIGVHETQKNAIKGLRPDGSKIVVAPEGKTVKGTTSLKKNLYDANAYGSKLASSVLGNRKFPFPKSLYSIYDILRFFLSEKKDATVLDFFVGSGTTQHALSLLNKVDGGKRKGIFVTNNETSDEDIAFAAELPPEERTKFIEENGICRHITWPRIKFANLGTNISGELLSEEYQTGNYTVVNNSVSFTHVKWTGELNLKAKKELVKLIDKLPAGDVSEADFIFSEKRPVWVVWGEPDLDEIEAVIPEEHSVEKVLFIGCSARYFTEAKLRLGAQIIGVAEEKPDKLPMAEGFSESLIYLKLDFLDPTSVELGRELGWLMHLLWLKSGAIGLPPSADACALPFTIYESSGFAILRDETKFREFKDTLNLSKKIHCVFIVTDSEELFMSISSKLNVRCVHLYKNYIENFRINGKLK